LILTTFFLFTAFAFALIHYGYKMQMDALRIVGFTFIIILGGYLLVNNMQIPDGTIITTINSTVTQEVTTYTNFNDQLIAFFYVITGIAGFIMVLVDQRNKKELQDE